MGSARIVIRLIGGVAIAMWLASTWPAPRLAGFPPGYATPVGARAPPAGAGQRRAAIARGPGFRRAARPLPGAVAPEAGVPAQSVSPMRP